MKIFNFFKKIYDYIVYRLNKKKLYAKYQNDREKYLGLLFIKEYLTFDRTEMHYRFVRVLPEPYNFKEKIRLAFMEVIIKHREEKPDGVVPSYIYDIGKIKEYVENILYQQLKDEIAVANYSYRKEYIKTFDKEKKLFYSILSEMTEGRKHLKTTVKENEISFKNIFYNREYLRYYKKKKKRAY